MMYRVLLRLELSQIEDDLWVEREVEMPQPSVGMMVEFKPSGDVTILDEVRIAGPGVTWNAAQGRFDCFCEFTMEPDVLSLGMMLERGWREE